MIRILFSKWVLIPLVLVAVFFGFAYWRGYSPGDVLVRVQSLLPGGGAPASTTTAPATTVVEHKENSIVSAGKQILQFTRSARSQFWDVFETSIGPKGFKHPIWVWGVLLVVTAVILLPGGLSMARRIGDQAGIEIRKPDDPQQFLIKLVAVIAAIAALSGAGVFLGWQVSVGLLVSLLCGYLLYEVGWKKVFEGFKNFIPGRQITAGDYIINLFATPFLLLGMVVLSLLAPTTMTVLIKPELVNASTINSIVTSTSGITASVIPRQLGFLSSALRTVAGVVLPAITLFTAGFTGWVMLLETAALTFILAMSGRIGRRGG